MDLSIEAALNNLSMTADKFPCDRDTRVILELSKEKIKQLVDKELSAKDSISKEIDNKKKLDG